MLPEASEEMVSDGGISLDGRHWLNERRRVHVGLAGSKRE